MVRSRSLIMYEVGGNMVWYVFLFSHVRLGLFYMVLVLVLCVGWVNVDCHVRFDWMGALPVSMNGSRLLVLVGLVLHISIGCGGCIDGWLCSLYLRVERGLLVEVISCTRVLVLYSKGLVHCLLLMVLR